MRYYILAIVAATIVFIGFYMTLSSYSFLGGLSTQGGGSNEGEKPTPGGYILGGTLMVKLKDVPKDWGESSHVFIHYGSIEIHRSDVGNQSGWSRAVEKGDWIDLRDVLSEAKVIGKCSLPSGDYNLIRFEIIEGIVTMGGLNYTSPVSSGKLTIAISRGGVRIETWQTSSVVIDVNPKVLGSRASGFRIVPSAKAYVET